MVQQLTDRLSGDAPFLVRIDGSRFLATAGALAGVGWLLAGGLLGGVGYLVAREAQVGRVFTAALVGVPVLLLGAVLAATVALWHGRFTGRGPVLAADRTGVWVANGSFRVNPVWLPWDAVSAVLVRRTWCEDLICIDAQTPHPAVPPGARLMVPTMLLDRRSADIVAVLSALAGGRAPVYGRW
ncbi:hypothetical protein O7623_25370 [Solwaraspora sp. WMMD791]|uniref:hypothetical protein n=1 Tax=Solwaraspora sp. WMMD791 TaxID=3016086 RepID=UPI00249AC809|nr:hypothetical protein [Solwaraspora sp. WMMD791]WFE26601.1 hypothetical protein O7623_25370 [Solwaraspora sp. WMMD791]